MSGASGPYAVQYDPKALKELAKSDKPVARRIVRAVDALAADPRPGGARPLVGFSNLWRIRVGDHRVIYTIRDADLVVLVLRVADTVRRAPPTPTPTPSPEPAATAEAAQVQAAQTHADFDSDDDVDSDDDAVDVPVLPEPAGMGTATTLRRHFHRAIGIPPDTYRRTFHHPNAGPRRRLARR